MDVITNQRSIITRKGAIPFPAYIPVTTFGRKYPLDDLIRPYLPRLAPAVMVSYYYAKQKDAPLRVPMMVDSGGFASLFDHARVIESQGLGHIEIQTDETKEVINPLEVLDFQERVADVAFTLDFPIPPSMEAREAREARKRQRLTIKNALWALSNRRRSDMPLYACVQGWDVESFVQCAHAYAGQGFDGVAIGGLVPRARNYELIESIIRGVRGAIGDLPIHVFGLGNPSVVNRVFECGADSVDSSAYVRLAAEGKSWNPSFPKIVNPSPTQRLHLALCNLANATCKQIPLSHSAHLTTTLI